MDLDRRGRSIRRLVINARKLDYGDGSAARLLVTVMDVTEARLTAKLKDDLLREKGILLQELQHRVANSLQIVASVLMQSARRTPSEQTRADLHDAHNRIMSVAEVQQQLAASRLGNVELRSYFTSLCRSIGASMIRDHDQITLDVSVDDSQSTADVSISLGLIVTELVINALKYAFPGSRVGRIEVGYTSHGADWQLSVSDDGVGMPTGDEPPKAGLGTNIVSAFAGSLDAEVETTDAAPGVKTSITHRDAE
jgi:two-component system, sensor histidine kinase PdtaS